jgi:hypothetical protein
MLTELLEKYGNQKPMDLGSHVEKTIPVSAVIRMMEEYHESKVKNLDISLVSNLFVNFIWEQYKVKKVITKKVYMQLVEAARKIN